MLCKPQHRHQLLTTAKRASNTTKTGPLFKSELIKDSVNISILYIASTIKNKTSEAQKKKIDREREQQQKINFVLL